MESLEHVLGDECPTCQGRDRVKTVETVCCELCVRSSALTTYSSSEQFVAYASSCSGLLNQRRIARFIARDRNVHQQNRFKSKQSSTHNQEQFDVVVM